MKYFSALAVSLLLITSSSQALLVTFNLRASGPEGFLTGSMTVDGLTANLSANSGKLNRTLGGYGVNAADSGDTTHLIDGGSGIAESISVSFSQSVLLTGLSLSSFSDTTSDPATATGDDIASLAIGGRTSINLLPTSQGTDVYTFATDNSVALGSDFSLTFVQHNGFSFDQFTVDTNVPPASVPESGTTLTFLGLAAFGLILFRRFQT